MKNQLQFCHPQHRFFDACALTVISGASLLLAFLLRFEFAVPGPARSLLLGALIFVVLAKGLVFHSAGLHRTLHRFAGLPDLLRLGAANLGGSVLFGSAVILCASPVFPRSVLIIDFLICFLMTTLFHFSGRIYSEVLRSDTAPAGKTGIVIYGAGVAGTTLVREITSSPSSGYKVVGFIDDDPAKQGALIFGVPILGRGRDAAWIVDRLNKRRSAVQQVVIAMPSASSSQMREAVANCRAAGVPFKTIPGINELLNTKILSAQLRETSLSDLLGRQPVHLDEAPVRNSVEGRCVLVTGAAGSIGSELCRQLARFHPTRLVALDQAESELFKIENEIRELHPGLDLVAALADIRDADRMSEVIRCNGVDSVFHAAAYKHVPMMEAHTIEAMRNNILGTWNVINAVRQHRVKNFLMISSDKAVNPASVMGASKRVCELIVSAVPEVQSGQIRCVSVRFGNVLGSNGSVVPIFRAQIAAGGPVKVTHPEMRRYFMTIPEAVSLVLQASTMGKGSEIFVLDMGRPLRILDLAENMIRLSGLTPYDDIDIQFTGLRPGEKLVEEINGASDRMLPTYHEKIMIFQDSPLEWRLATEWIEQLRRLLAEHRESALVTHLQRVVPEYRPGAAHLREDRSAKAGALTRQAEHTALSYA